MSAPANIFRIGSARRFAADGSGVAAIEAAIILPVFLVALFLICEFGRLFYAKLEFEYAMSTVARFGMVTKTVTKAQLEQKLKDQLILLNPANLATVSFIDTANPNNTHTTTLVISYRVDFMVPVTSYQSVTLTKSTSFLRGA